MTRNTLIAFSCGLLAATSAAIFFLPSGHESGHVEHNSSTGTAPREAGQSAFAALSEIVSILSTDATTDWSKVKIDDLRQHLVDMDKVTLSARVERETLPEGLRFTITGETRTAEAIKRMVPAHAAVMNGNGESRFATEVVENGVILTLENLSDAERARFDAIGFFGFMATGAHHQPHHLAMAKGRPVHSH
ncbi:MAG: hypothetical protein AAFQ10_10515 [Pseudomonadota bacterium]